MIPDNPIFAVTGSNGKTTAVLLTKFVLEYQGIKTAVLDNWKGCTAFEKQKERASWDGTSCLLVEAPVEMLRQRRLPTSMFKAAALLNLAAEHPCGTRGKNKSYRLISSFFNELPEGARAILNVDDPQALSLVQDGPYNLITFATDYSNAMVVATNVQYSGLTATFDLQVNGELISLSGQVIMPATCTVYLPMAGRHNISNALLAAIISLLMGVNLQDIGKALSLFPGIRRQLEVVYNGYALIIDDSAQNPAAIRAVLDTVEKLDRRRVIIVHGLSGGSGGEINSQNAMEMAGWLAARPRDSLLVTRSMYHVKNRHRVQLDEEKAFFNTLREKETDFAYFPDLPDVLESALSHAQEDDVVLLLGGPVLNRAQELLIQILGDNFPALVPGAPVPLVKAGFTQGISVNPS
ncbi:MAG: hypothetical protein KGZ79_12770 [Dethiobacter sp.]|jgi:UDP-N-acetylmuramate-alanine ligase|nr:hypothetical protein [Dethiobacter sp.]